MDGRSLGQPIQKIDRYYGYIFHLTTTRLLNSMK